MTNKKIQEKLNEIFQRMSEDNVYGDELSKFLIELAILMGAYGQAITDLERVYINKQIEVMNEKDLSVGKSEIFVKATDEYNEWKKAKELEKALIETIRSIKYRIRILENEKETY